MTGFRLATASPEETRALGRLLGAAVAGPVALFLTGGLGAGKTCLVQGLAEGLGVPPDEPVTSPTYTLMNPHRGRLDLFHFDLYRLTGPGDLVDLGFEDYFDGAGVAVVEWAERIPELGDEGLWVGIEATGEATRAFTFHARGAAAEELLTALQARWSERGERA